MFGDRVEADRLEVGDGGTEPDGLADGGSAGLELPRDVVDSEAVQPDIADHLAAAEERRHRLEQLLACPQDADAGRAEHLVAGEGEEVDTEAAHVEGPVRDEL